QFILPPSNTTSVSTIILTPISPGIESESSTFNDSYVRIQNEKNESPAADDYESMDETDFPPPPPPLKSTLTVDYITSANSLQKVFCCSTNDGSSSVRLTRPGSAVQIHPEKETNDKVGDSEDDQSTNPVNTPDDDFGTSDNAPTPSPTSPAQLENHFAPNSEEDEAHDENDDEEEEPSDSPSEHSLTAPTQKSHGRFSPKTYNEMIKFVFTEHGIRVISDKEYVV
ncbi:CLUMA_CG003748, isoform A, partial [Clunio marinus]